MAGLNKAMLKEMYEENYMSIPEIKESVGLPLSTIRHRLLSCGVVLRSRKEGVVVAMQRGRFKPVKGNSKPRTIGQKRRMRAFRLRHSAKVSMGVRVTSSGYLEYTMGHNKGRLVHRVIMEAHLGRPIRHHEHIHHDDGNKLNNCIDNLKIMALSEHSRLHRIIEHPRKRNNAGQFLKGS